VNRTKIDNKKLKEDLTAKEDKLRKLKEDMRDQESKIELLTS
jgi:hypothetical protein